MRAATFYVLFSAFCILGLFSVFVIPAEAATQCQCVCDTPTGGISGQTTTTDKAAEVCANDCEARGGSFNRCATDLSGLPENNPRCFTQTECQNRLVQVNGEDRPSEFGDKQPPDCIAGYHYCYNPPIPVNLNTAISTLQNPEQATSLGEYIIAIYDLLLPSAAIMAVVLMMVAGLEWATAAGSQERVSRAKDRITKAVIGLVLIMAAYSIVYLVDPRLTSFEDLKVPILKGAEFLDEGTSCGRLEELGFEVEYLSEGTDQDDFLVNAEGACGSRCRIVEVPEGVAFAGDIKVGDQFFGDICGQLDSTCVIKGTGAPESKTGICARCWDFNPNDNKQLSIPPSSSTCAKADPLDELNQLNAGTVSIDRPYARCFASSDSDIITGLGSVLAGSTCALFYMDCSAISTCQQYGEVRVVSGPAPSAQKSAFQNGFEYLVGLSSDTAYLYEIDTGDVTFQSICTTIDPCGMNCQWDPSADLAERCKESGDLSGTGTGQGLEGLQFSE